MKNSDNKFNLMAVDEINEGMSMLDFIAATHNVDDSVRVTMPEIGSKLKIKLGKKIVLKKISRGTKNGENRLTLYSFRSVFNESTAGIKIFFGKQVIVNARIENDRVILET